MNRYLTTGVLKIRTKKETIKGKRDCEGTLGRLLALFFFSATFNQTALVTSEDTTKGGLADKHSSTNDQAGPGDCTRQQPIATPLLWIQ